MDFKEHFISREHIYQGRFIDLYEDRVLLPNQQEGLRIIVDHIGAAAVLALTPSNEVILVKQYRYAAGCVTLEIPAGKKDHKDDDPLKTAKRELEEETGYVSNDWTPLGSAMGAIGFCTERVYFYLAKNCVLKENPLPPDEGEFVEVVVMPLDEAVERVHDDQLIDAKTIITLLKAQKKVRENSV